MRQRRELQGLVLGALLGGFQRRDLGGASPDGLGLRRGLNDHVRKVRDGRRHARKGDAHEVGGAAGDRALGRVGADRVPLEVLVPRRVHRGLVVGRHF